MTPEEQRRAYEAKAQERDNSYSIAVLKVLKQRDIRDYYEDIDNARKWADPTTIDKHTQIQPPESLSSLHLAKIVREAMLTGINTPD